MSPMSDYERNEELKKYILQWYIYIPHAGAMMKRQRPDHPFKSAPYFVGKRIAKKKGPESKITIKGHQMPFARVAFLLMKGDWPKGIIIHKNKNGFDQRWENLQELKD